MTAADDQGGGEHAVRAVVDDLPSHGLYLWAWRWLFLNQAGHVLRPPSSDVGPPPFRRVGMLCQPEDVSTFSRWKEIQTKKNSRRRTDKRDHQAMLRDREGTMKDI